MQTTKTTVLGMGALYECRTRDGGRLRVIGERGGVRQLVLYGAPDQLTVRLEADEADQLADLLRSGSMQDRVAALERRLAALTSAERRT
jgi:K+/H+ antiporter YhaU regulatory subunit KhtT